MTEMFTVGILGASGFIGSRLVEWLVLHDLARVRPIVRSFKAMTRLARFDLDVRLADATDPRGLEGAVPGCDVLVHCVAGGREATLQSIETAYRVAAAVGARRLVYLSSAGVHGQNPAPRAHDDGPLVARQPLEDNVSKVMGENLLRSLRSDGAVEVVTLRPMIVLGPRSRKWTAQIATDLLGGRAYLIDGGSGICNSVYIDNLVHAMWLATTAEKAANQDFIITDGERVSWRDLYSSLAEAVGVDINSVPSLDRTILKGIRWRREWLELPGFPTIHRAMIQSQLSRYVLPIRKAQELIGYVPQVSFSEGCRRTREWVRFAFGLREETEHEPLRISRPSGKESRQAIGPGRNPRIEE